MTMMLQLASSLLLLSLLPQMIHGATVSIRRDAAQSDVFNDTHKCVYDGGEIVLSHPMSIGLEDKHYILGSQMLEAAHITLDAVNLWPRCGVSLYGKNYSLALQTYGDESSKDKTRKIGEEVVDDNVTHFLLAGYSSGLTGHLTPVAEANQKLCITAGSSRTSVHANRGHVFGMLPPSNLYLVYAFEGLKQQGAQTVGYISSTDSVACDGVQEMADMFDMELLGAESHEAPISPETFEAAAFNMSRLNPDIVVACVRQQFLDWNKAMRTIDWTPKAMVYTVTFGTPEYEEQMSASGDLSYTMGVASWDRALPPLPDGATGWTPYDFDAVFHQAAFRRPAYQHTSQSAAISVLVQALERVNLPILPHNQTHHQLVTERVKDAIATSYFPTVYGNISFDQNGQSAAPQLLLQYDHFNTLHVLLPEDRKGSEFEIVYPMPSWAYRDCEHKSRCVRTQGAYCTDEGTCACPHPLLSKGIRGYADCVEPPPASTTDPTNYAVLVAVPLAVFLGLAAALGVYYHHQKRKNDSLWQISKDELIFEDPPQVLGRGTFGMVLLAEFRGTQVAVKKVIPSSSNNKSNNGDGNSEETRETADVENPGMKSGMASQQRTNTGMSSWGAMSMSLGGANGRFSLLGGTSSKKRKTVNEAAMLREMKADFIEEMRHLSKLRHPCVTTVMGAITKGDPMLVMEYMDHGSLYDLLHNETMVLEGELLLPMLRDITQGMRFLHSSTPQVIHGDLKAANVLVDNRFRCKVADFGLSQKENLGGTGTPLWMAPELLNMESANTTASDVYSFGIILYEVYSRRDPYEGENAGQVLKLVADPKIKKRPGTPRNMSDQVKGLMADCLEHAPDARPSFEELDTRLKRADAETVSAGQTPVKKSTISLFDIFPKHVAQALADGRTPEAEHKDCVTIFFSDIVGFTTISSTLDPRKVATMLDRLYTKLDALSNKHDVFKVETIGDAYMAVTNLVKDQSTDHVERIARFSIDAIQAANETMIDLDDPQKGTIQIRVGFHSGPVVADVVGSRNPRYCLFGDTVNVASRMESSSIAGRIHCSKASAELLEQQAPEMPLTSRGQVKIKGKGGMITYWVNKRGEFVGSAPPKAHSGELRLSMNNVKSLNDFSFSNIEEEHTNADFSNVDLTNVDLEGGAFPQEKRMESFRDEYTDEVEC